MAEFLMGEAGDLDEEAANELRLFTNCMSCKNKSMENWPVVVYGSSAGARYSLSFTMPPRSPRTKFKVYECVWTVVMVLLLVIGQFSVLAEFTKEFEVSEGVSVGTSIGDVSEGGTPGPPYLIVPMPGIAVDSDLIIDETSGKIRTKVPLDRETRGEYSFVAIPSSGENIRVVIRVLDENDNAPEFAIPVMQIHFPENTPRDVKRTLQPALDKDLGLFNTQRYKIVSGNVGNTFRLSSHREKDGVLYLDLQINGFLDRETKPYYTLVIEAYDGGSPPLKGSMTVNITIQDVNDNQPIFNQSRYYGTIPENATLGTSVLQVFATDTDTGDNGRVSYSINRRQSDRDEVFAIDENTGVIRVNRPLDFESKEVHELVAVARDNGAQALETTAFVSVRVLDVNDNQPTINLIFLSDDATPKISEEAQPGEIVARISVNDPDSKEEYSNVNVTLEGGDGHFGLTTRDSIIYLVIVSLPLDRETQANYTLSVTATDQGSPPLHAARTFDLRVTDANDNAPEFEETVYHASVLEVADPGTSVFSLSATDRDEGVNAQVTYSIVDGQRGSSSDWFQIDPKTGLITTKAHVDCETDSSPRIRVQAVDGGEPALSSTTEVVITIRDINDNEPTFDQSFYNVSVKEDAQVHDCILQPMEEKRGGDQPAASILMPSNEPTSLLIARVLNNPGEPEARTLALAELVPLCFMEVLAQLDDLRLSEAEMVLGDPVSSFRQRAAAASLIAQQKEEGPAWAVSSASSNRSSQRGVGSGGGLVGVDGFLPGASTPERGQTASSGVCPSIFELKFSLEGRVFWSVARVDLSPSHCELRCWSLRSSSEEEEDEEEEERPITRQRQRATGDGKRANGYIMDFFSRNAWIHQPSTELEEFIDAGKESERLMIYDRDPQITMATMGFEEGAVGFEEGAVGFEDEDSQNLWCNLDLILSPHCPAIRRLRHHNRRLSQRPVPVHLNKAQEALYRTRAAIKPQGEGMRSSSVLISASLSLTPRGFQVSATDPDCGVNAIVNYSLAEPASRAGEFYIESDTGKLCLASPLDRETRAMYEFPVIATDRGGQGEVFFLIITSCIALHETDFYDDGVVLSSTSPTSHQKTSSSTPARWHRALPDVSACSLLLPFWCPTTPPGLGVGLFNRGPACSINHSLAHTDGFLSLSQPPVSLKRVGQHQVIDSRHGTSPANDSPAKDVNQDSWEEDELVRAMPGSTTTLMGMTGPPHSDLPSFFVALLWLQPVQQEQPSSLRLSPADAASSVRVSLVSYSNFKLYDGPLEKEEWSGVAGRSVDCKIWIFCSWFLGPVQLQWTVEHHGLCEGGFPSRGRLMNEMARPLKTPDRQLELANLMSPWTCLKRNRNASSRERVIFQEERLHRTVGRTRSRPPSLRGLSTSAMVKILVLDVNDNSPVFYPREYNVSLRQGPIPQGPIVAVVAEDPDSGTFGRISYSIVSGNQDRVFRINSETGELFMSRPLYNLRGLGSLRPILLSIQAHDGGGREAREAAQIRLSMVSADQRPPLFERNRYVFVVQEGLGRSTPVGSVKATVADGSHSSNAKESVRYSIQSGDPDGFFRIDEQSGTIFTTAELDHERNPFLILNIQARAGTPPTYGNAQVNISIQDINDNAPEFEFPSVTVSIPESAETGTSVYVANAVDRDAGANGQVTYSLLRWTGEEQHFRVDRVTGSITLNRALDYETEANYTLTLEGRDHGTPPLTSTLEVIIHVQDANDNPPKFEQDVYQLEFPEDSPLNTPLLTVVAHDRDSGNNARITYTIVPSEHGTSSLPIGIFPNSGVLYLKGEVDRETRDSYEFQVQAQDNGFPSFNSRTKVILKVTDVNDNAPVFQGMAGDREYHFSVEEAQRSGTVLGRIKATDRDLGSNGTVIYRISGKNDANLQLNGNTGELSTLVPLDRERHAEYRLSVTASDMGQPPMVTTAEVLITVRDVNDHSPEFVEPRSNRLSVREEQPIGTHVTKVQAIDRDEGENATVRYFIPTEGNDPSTREIFSLDADSGIIRTRAVLSQKEKNSYVLVVEARDQGRPRALSQTLKLTIIVLDLSDNRPTSAAASLHYELPEDAPIGTHVGLIGRDLSSSPSRFYEVTQDYSIADGNVDGCFAVDGNLIVTACRLDRETRASYSLRIRSVEEESVAGGSYGFPLGLLASSPPGKRSLPDESAAVVFSVDVTILDVNDELPTFKADPLLATVSEGDSVGSLVFNFSAVDRDQGRNGEVGYRLVEQWPKDHFRLDSTSGQLTLLEALDYEQVPEYTLVVEATDAGRPPQSSRVTAILTVQDVNDHRPEFRIPRKDIQVREDEPVGTSLLQVGAVDKDTGVNGRLTYGIVSGNEDGEFHLDADSGMLTLAAPLDRERRARYVLNVSVSDGGSPEPMLDYENLSISVLDVNDHAPMFSQRTFFANISEDSSVGSFVLRLRAMDLDQEGGSQNLSFGLNLESDSFRVDPLSGEVFTISSLDREKTAELELSVFVKDSGDPPLFDDATVRVRILDINDHAPRFPASCYPLVVPENSEFGVIHRMIAVDEDEGPNAQITYSLAGGNIDNQFLLDPVTGALSSGLLDREMRDRYHLIVVAEDRGVPPRRGTCNLTVHVKDENDNPPRFPQASYHATLPEDALPGRSVLELRALDPDMGRNARITYSLTNETQWLFTVNNESGLITTTGMFDREKESTYSFEVRATDGGEYNAHWVQVKVVVSISDINDHSPVFKEYPFRQTVSEDTQQGQKLLLVTATDEDAGQNAQITYKLAPSASSMNRFAIDPNTGELSALTSLKPDAGSLFLVEVIAEDGGQPSRSSTGLVEIQVGRTSGPVTTIRFSEATYEVSLDEDARPGRDVVKVQAARTDGRRQRITYSFGSGNEDGAFDINSNNGLIRVRDPTHLDYEQRSSIRLIVVARTEGHSPLFGYATVKVDLIDANDNSPRFTQVNYATVVWEGNSKGTFVAQVSATDDDSGENAAISYHIVDGNPDNAFAIDPPLSGIVKTNIVLDREIRDSYYLTIMASDQGQPQRTGTAMLRISVVDINDNKPTFPPHTNVSIVEDAEVGSLVTTVTANDVDTAPPLTYALVPSQGAAATDISAFSIDRFTGKILLAQPLDFERQSSYSVQVSASDSSHVENTVLTVHVLDQNDNPPVFQHQAYDVTVPASLAPGTSVLTLQATDKDSRRNGDIQYSIARESVSVFTIDAELGTLHLNRSLDSISASMIEVVVAARDRGRPKGRTAFAKARLRIARTLRENLEFRRNYATVSVKEDSPVGTTLFRAPAPTSLCCVVFSLLNLSPSEEEQFHMISSTGELILTNPLDRETRSNFSLKIMAADRDDSGNNVTMTLQIDVQDVNDFVPRFEQSTFALQIPEDKPRESSVFQVHAIDRDLGEHGSVFYHLTSGNVGAVFRLDGVTGVLSLAQELDFESRSSYVLVVKAADNDPERPLSSYCLIRVEVQDQNEHKPIFPSRLLHGFVFENAPPETPVLQIRAVDADGGRFGRLNYTLVAGGKAGDDWERFRLDATTGTLYSKEVFDYEEQREFAMAVTARDAGGLSTTGQVRIHVQSQDEFAPSFSQSSYTFAAPRDVPAGYVIGRVYADDQDQGPDGAIVYQLAEGDRGDWTVNATTGDILANRPLQGMSGQSTLNLVVSSGRLGSLRARTQVTVQVNPELTAGIAAASGSPGGSGMAPWALALIVSLALLAVGLAAVIFVIRLRGRYRHKPPPSEHHYDNPAPSDFYAPDPYSPNNTLPPYSYATPPSSTIKAGMNPMLELSENSASASSGRGSAEDEEEDEELRMINEGSLRQQSNLSESPMEGTASVVPNTADYLARLGITGSRGGPPSSNGRQSIYSGAGSGGGDTGSKKSQGLYLFHDEAGRQGDIDLNSLFRGGPSSVASSQHRSTTGAPTVLANGSHNHAHHLMAPPPHHIHHSHEMQPPPVPKGPSFGQPSMTGSLSSIVHSEEELAGSYNWDYLLDWGPQYQPLAHVFSEIARLKDDSPPASMTSSPILSPKKPPPLLTSLPPRSIAALPSRSSHYSHDPISSGTGMGFAISPSFSPALSPLAARPPSISPSVVPPPRPTPRRIPSSAPASEREMRI
ncbi:unnamed protein product [Cyprideis torosa]|uniref:Protocadherin-16 n=1 Tax=Cyprideis torosa TaxID=163714 RepID=A0A7R8W6N8_9CRUS|nr:unnamed protein product [Cyprideis torosa]CAG0886653.1 unnamed protein product [Cyprideis torosa]